MLNSLCVEDRYLGCTMTSQSHCLLFSLDCLHWVLYSLLHVRPLYIISVSVLHCRLWGFLTPQSPHHVLFTTLIFHFLITPQNNFNALNCNTNSSLALFRNTPFYPSMDSLHKFSSRICFVPGCGSHCLSYVKRSN